MSKKRGVFSPEFRINVAKRMLQGESICKLHRKLQSSGARSTDGGMPIAGRGKRGCAAPWDGRGAWRIPSLWR